MLDSKPRTPEPTITRITGKHGIRPLRPPKDYMASAVVRLMQVDTEKDQRIYAWWAVSGQYDGRAAEVTFNFDGAHSVRFDIPRGGAISTSYLQPWLRYACQKDPSLPPSTPIIKE